MPSLTAILSDTGRIQEILVDGRSFSAGDDYFEHKVRTDVRLPHGPSIYFIRDMATREVFRVGETADGVWRNIVGFLGGYPNRTTWAGRRIEIVHFTDSDLADSLLRDAVEASLLQGKKYPGNTSPNENKGRLKAYLAAASDVELETLDRLVRQIAARIAGP